MGLEPIPPGTLEDQRKPLTYESGLNGTHEFTEFSPGFP